MRTAAASLALALVLVACTGGTKSPPPPPTSVTTQPTPVDTAPATRAPTTATSLGFERPIAIDVAYVQRVLDEIYRLDGEAARRRGGEAARYIYTKGLPDAEFNERLKAIFGGPALEESKSVYGQAAAQRFITYANPPGNPKMTVRRVVETTSTCILVTAELDFRPLYKASDRTEPAGVVILSTADVLPLNPTGWGVVEAGKPTQDRVLTAC